MIRMLALSVQFTCQEQSRLRLSNQLKLAIRFYYYYYLSKLSKDRVAPKGKTCTIRARRNNFVKMASLQNIHAFMFPENCA